MATIATANTTLMTPSPRLTASLTATQAPTALPRSEDQPGDPLHVAADGEDDQRRHHVAADDEHLVHVDPHQVQQQEPLQ